ncbi:MAG: hypothetical protein ABH952_04060 [Candidatus Omnitrophota bacterium]
MKKKNLLRVTITFIILLQGLTIYAQEREFLVGFLPVPSARYVRIEAQKFYNVTTNPVLPTSPCFDMSGESKVNILRAKYFAAPIITGLDAGGASNDNVIDLGLNGESNLVSVTLGGNVNGVGGVPQVVNYAVLNVWGKIIMKQGLGAADKHIRDIAEAITLRKCEPADLVIIDPEFDNCVTVTDKPYDLRVAGVVSENPDFLLGRAGTGEGYLCLAGKVYCNVTTINGTISPGDMLVSSVKKGYAMRADPDFVKPGTVIGKALEPLNEGEGKILILVNQG